jgi:hypothetical protein
MNTKIKKQYLNEIIFCNITLGDYLKNSELDKDIDLIRLYTKDFSDWINHYLRSGKKNCECKNYIISCINSNLNKQIKYNKKIVYRMENSFEENFLDKLDKNNNVEIPFLLSTSKDDWKNRNHTIEIKTLNQSKSVDLELFGIFSSELEVLFPTNTKFKLLSINNNYVKMEEINNN